VYMYDFLNECVFLFYPQLSFRQRLRLAVRCIPSSHGSTLQPVKVRSGAPLRILLQHLL